MNKYPSLKEVLQGGLGTIKFQEPRRRVTPLSHQMLRGKMRDYVIDKVKKPLFKAIVILSKRYPEPTRENCLNPNSQILFDIRDKFFSYLDNPGRVELFRAIFRILIATYEHDPWYRALINWFIEELVELTLIGKWLPRGKDRPIICWKEPKPFGLYEGRRFKKLITGGTDVKTTG